MKKKILITGGSGLLGSNIAKLALQKFKVYATYYQHEVKIKEANFFPIDLTNENLLARIEQIRPDDIIHCAALTNVDYCEEHPKEAYKQNVIASANIARIAKKINSYFIHISTDAVFDGKKGNYKEDDKLNPINVYAKTKLEAEQKVLSIYPQAGIVRTNIYGWNKQNKFSLAEWMLNKLENNEELPGLEDVFFSPILVNQLANYLFKLLKIKYKGILHVGGRERCSKLDFAYQIAKVFNLIKKLIKPVSLNQLNLIAQRPKDTSLAVAEAEEILKLKLPTIKQGLKKMKQLRNQGYMKELKYG